MRSFFMSSLQAWSQYSGAITVKLGSPLLGGSTRSATLPAVFAAAVLRASGFFATVFLAAGFFMLVAIR